MNMLVKLYLQNLLESYYVKYQFSFRTLKELALLYGVPIDEKVIDRCEKCNERFEFRTLINPCEGCKI